MTLQEELDKIVGPAPQAPPDMRFLGWRLNQPEMEQYEAKRRVYDAAVAAATHELAPQILNPLRNSSLQDVATISGYNPREIATPDQYQTRVDESPSLVPKTTMHYTAAGDNPMGEVLTPYTFRPQGPPDLRMDGPDGWMNADAPRALKYPADQTMYRSEPVQLQGPPNPARPEFYQREGDPLRTEVTELNLNAPSTLHQQMLGVSGLKREGSWPRQSGNKEGSKQFQYNQIKAAYGDDAANYWLAEGMLPNGMKSENLSARTNSSEARAGLMGAQHQNMDLKNSNYQREADDRHANSQSLIASRENMMKINNTMLPLRKNIMELDAQLKQQRLAGDTPELQQAQAKIDLAREKLTLLEKLVVATKGEVNNETLNLLWEDISGMAGIVNDVGKQGFWQKINPFSPAPQPQRSGQLSPAQPVAPTTPATVTPQQPVAPSKNAEGNPFSDAPPGKKPGQVLQKDGKPVADWDGERWVPR